MRGYVPAPPPPPPPPVRNDPLDAEILTARRRAPADVDVLVCPWGCGHRAADVAERNTHALVECDRREPEPRRGANGHAAIYSYHDGRTLAEVLA
jgi:hypothetical protein